MGNNTKLNNIEYVDLDSINAKYSHNKASKRSGNFLLDPSSQLYQGSDTNNSSFLQSDSSSAVSESVNPSDGLLNNFIVLRNNPDKRYYPEYTDNLIIIGYNNIPNLSSTRISEDGTIVNEFADGLKESEEKLTDISTNEFAVKDYVSALLVKIEEDPEEVIPDSEFISEAKSIMKILEDNNFDYIFKIVRIRGGGGIRVVKNPTQSPDYSYVSIPLTEDELSEFLIKFDLLQFDDNRDWVVYNPSVNYNSASEWMTKIFNSRKSSSK